MLAAAVVGDLLTTCTVVSMGAVEGVAHWNLIGKFVCKSTTKRAGSIYSKQ